MSGAYYNDTDPEAVAALRQLITENVIAPGEVDDRSIKDVSADDLKGYTQCHFFAGAGLWSVAARLAGWPDGRRLWSASCPCQPFSSAGARLGADDPRHLWPDLHRIVGAARASGFGPPILVGEQIAGTAGYGWFDGVRADLAREEISARTIDIPACAIDAPHERNRLWWIAVANTEGERGRRELAERGPQGRAANRLADAARDLGDTDSAPAGRDSGSVSGSQAESGRKRQEPRGVADRSWNADGAMADRHIACERGHGGGARSPASPCSGETRPADGNAAERGDDPRSRRNEHPGAGGSLVNATRERWGEGRSEPDVLSRRPAFASADLRQCNGSWWADAEWIACHDGKARRAKPGIPMLVDGMAGRASVWRLAGNSIVPQLAAEVIAAFLDAEFDSGGWL